MVVFLVVVLLMAATAFLALSETALIASKHARLQEWRSAHNKGAERALALKDHSDRLLSTIEVGVTAISIILGAYSEGTVSSALQNTFKHAGLLANVHAH